MNSQPSALIERPAMASRSVEKVSGRAGDLTGPNNKKLHAFTVKVAWVFASAVIVLVVVGLVLVVAGYAGSIFAPDVQPKTVPASWPRK